MSACQVNSCSCEQSLPMRGNISICVGCNHSISVHLKQDDDEVEIIRSSNGKFSIYELLLINNK